MINRIHKHLFPFADIDNSSCKRTNLAPAQGVAENDNGIRMSGRTLSRQTPPSGIWGAKVTFSDRSLQSPDPLCSLGRFQGRYPCRVRRHSARKSDAETADDADISRSSPRRPRPIFTARADEGEVIPPTGRAPGSTARRVPGSGRPGCHPASGGRPTESHAWWDGRPRRHPGPPADP